MRSRDAFKLVLMIAGIVFALLPDRYLPDGEGVNLEGVFEGHPVEVAWRRQNKAPYSFALVLEQGVCEFVQRDASGAIVDKWSAQRTTSKGRIAPGGRLQFSPMPGAVGRFHIRVGRFIVLGSLLTVIRVVISVVCLSGIAAVLFGWRIWRRGQDSRRWRVAAAILAFSGVVVYSLVHEGGHLLFGVLSGGRPNWHAVRWTVFSGEEPHVAFEYLPADAIPWMTAGGILLPTFVGIAVIAAWWLLGRRAVWWLQLLAVIPGLMLLFGNLGLFAEAGHTLPLAAHLGMHGAVAQIVARSPAFVTLLIFAVIAMRPELIMVLRSETSAPAEQESGETTKADA